MPRDDDSRILACDLDGTLIDINSFPSFVRFAEAQFRHESRWPEWLMVISALIKRKVMRRDHTTLKAVICRVGVHLDEAALDAWVGKLLTDHLNPEVDRFVRDWDGKTLLTTAAPEVYAVKIAEQLGFDYVHGSRLAGEHIDNNESDRKCERLRELGGIVEVAVSDDPEIDGPLLALANNAFVVIAGDLFRYDAVAGPRPMMD